MTLKPHILLYGVIFANFWTVSPSLMYYVPFDAELNSVSRYSTLHVFDT
jgi:hypothetical protein